MFADYLQKIEDIGAEPPTVPVIKTASEVWRHIELQSVRAFGSNIVVVYAVPAWDENLHHEWCIEGIDTLLYVGQSSVTRGTDIEAFATAIRPSHMRKPLRALAIFLSHGPEMPNKAMGSAPGGRPTRKSDALLLAAHRSLYAA